MTRLLRAAGALSAALAVALPLAALGLDRLAGQRVQLVTAGDPATVRVNRSLYQPGDPVAEIYGTPAGQPLRVLFVGDRVLAPPEDPALRLLLLDKQRGDNPLQARTLWYLCWRLSLVLGLAGLGSLALGRLLSRRRGATPARVT